jgi:hypothetical protein
MNRWLSRESEEWEKKGIIDAAQRQQILARYSVSGWQQQVLSLLAGAAIGASIIAFWALLTFEMNIQALREGWSAAGFFLGFGVPLVVLGLLWKRPEFARPALLGGLMPLLVAAVIPDTNWFPWVILAALLGSFARMYKENLRAVLLVAAIFIALPIASASTLDEEPGMTVWFLLSMLAFAGIWLAKERSWTPISKVLASLSVIASWFAFVIGVIDPSFDGGLSLTFSAGMILMVALVVWQKESGATLAFGLALTAGLVAFAFEAGGPIPGVISLISLSAAFLFLSFRKSS